MALKIVYKICCGIDVHRTFVVACIAFADCKGVSTYESHCFSTCTKCLKNLLQQLFERNSKTSIWNLLVNTGFLFIIFWKKNVPLSLLILSMLRLSMERKLTRKIPNGLLVCSSMILLPEALCCQLRELKRYRFKLTCFQSSKMKRLQNCFTVSNIQLVNVVSDTFGKFAQAILDKLLENPADNSSNSEPLVFKSLKKKLPELRDAIDGYITPEQAGKLKVIKAHYQNLEFLKAELEELILALAAPCQQELAILQTTPGISSDFTAIGIISEIGTNMEVFPSAKHLCSWAGLTPTNNESAEKKNLSESPKLDATSSRYLCSAPTLLLPAKSVLKFVTAIYVSKSVAVTRKQLLS